jgi:crotonobetainyl-CoA:carnitine CoA-transferase CaiB-like acyl-CoA transferase
VHPTGGKFRVASPYVHFAGSRPARGRPTPLLGEQANEVLAEAGHSVDDIARLRRAGTIVSDKP